MKNRFFYFILACYRTLHQYFESCSSQNAAKIAPITSILMPALCFHLLNTVGVQRYWNYLKMLISHHIFSHENSLYIHGWISCISDYVACLSKICAAKNIIDCLQLTFKKGPYISLSKSRPWSSWIRKTIKHRKVHFNYRLIHLPVQITPSKHECRSHCSLCLLNKS